MRHHVVLSAILGVIVSLSTPDFIEIQKLSSEELLRRFRLPAGHHCGRFHKSCETR